MEKYLNLFISDLVKRGYSDVYIEAVTYGKFKHSFSLRDITNKINELKKQ